MNCKICGKELFPLLNKTGYCKKCFTKSSQYKEYQRNYHRNIWYAKEENREKIKLYKLKNKIRIKEYMTPYLKKYNQLPEVKAKKNEYGRLKRLKEKNSHETS